jgi:GNAT superfamily N-acetyltransferase
MTRPEIPGTTPPPAAAASKPPRRKLGRATLRRAFALLPRAMRFAIFRAMIDCDPAPDQRLSLKIADTQDELEACFRILHDAYVSSGFMKPDPSGMRVTCYHALPTTTTLCAKYDGEVVGTISLVREGVFGFPMQSAFDLSGVRRKPGHIAEISALAVHPGFRKTGGAILFPLMKFMREYCTTYFDTRHIVIAVNPNRIEMYESLLFFERLQENVIENYDFANGAPAVGATLDLELAPGIFKRHYGGKRPRKDLHNYFFQLVLPNIEPPNRRYFTTNDPVMTPAMLDYFFNRRQGGFESFDERKRMLLHEIYDLDAYRHVLPPVPQAPQVAATLRRHTRYSLKCPGKLEINTQAEPGKSFGLHLTELSREGFQAESDFGMPLDMVEGTVTIELGEEERSVIKAKVVRKIPSEFGEFYGFHVEQTDPAWERCVDALQRSQTSSDLNK